ncbi:MAG: DUF4271 domain-containing protein [Bacteroidales bacterium]|nr:DUF4271 domain-containing protein [Bacteroidales bacterium]
MTTFLQTLDQAWPGSTKIADYTAFLQDSAAPGPGYYWPMTILVLLAVFYCIIFFNRIALASSLSLRTFFSSSEKIQNICENQTSLSAVNAACVICLPVLVMLLFNRGWTGMDLSWLCVAFIAFLIIRVIAFEFIAWYKGTDGVFDTIRNSWKVTMVAAVLLAIPSFVIPMFFGQEYAGFARSFFLAVFTGCFLIYCGRACKYLLEAGFSIFFCFLYLCALELLPAGLLISAIISL